MIELRSNVKINDRIISGSNGGFNLDPNKSPRAGRCRPSEEPGGTMEVVRVGTGGGPI